MILDTLSNSTRYRPLGARIAQGLDWIHSFDPAASDGRYEIDGEHIYALVQSYETSAHTAKRYEAHRAYLDIQYMAAGNETILYAPLVELPGATAYDERKDFSLFDDPAVSTPLHMGPGSIAIFFPDDGHKPGCDNGVRQYVKKVVLKVLLR